MDDKHGIEYYIFIVLCIASVLCAIILIGLLIIKKDKLKKSQKLLISSFIFLPMSIVFFLMLITGALQSNSNVYILMIVEVMLFVGGIILLIMGITQKNREKNANKINNIKIQDVLQQPKIIVIEKKCETFNKKEYLYCSYCGLKVDKTEKKCPNCGAHIK